MIAIIKNVFDNTVMITAFVLVMMLIIEFVNVRTRGMWAKQLKKNALLQVIFASLLGIIPGCLGTFTLVSLYTHNIVSFGALVANLIATFGDEAFFMFSMMPKTALLLTLIIFGIAVVTGLVVSIFDKKKTAEVKHFEIHENEELTKIFDRKQIIENFKKITFSRSILIGGIALFLLKMIFSGDSHQQHTANLDHVHHGEWVNITFIVVSIVGLFIVSTVSNHFLNEHLWQHIIKKHFIKIFLWTAGALLFIEILLHYLTIEQFSNSALIYILIAALLVGLIPESGPHLVFVSLFISGTIPLSILLASSIVQDGHGALPLFAESKADFFKAKLINLFVGAVVGATGLITGW